ncbi:MAG TPA: PQQ-binding-like beta-propeller repeat protein [Candidatus Binataceae bacterium]|nr:PQQ-binding-like beta-propeller repeat protein [Candidatus Binataceae bacterium]
MYLLGGAMRSGVNMRGAFTALASIALLSVLTTSTMAQGASEDASSFQINPAHDGSVDFAAGFSAPLVKAWTYDTGGTVSSPLMALGALYLVSNSNDVFAINLANGKKLWEHLLGSGINLGAYDNGMLFFYSGTRLAAIKAKNGKQLWSLGNFAGTLGSDNSGAPIAVKGMLYIGGLSIAAYDEMTGENKWVRPILATASQVAYGDNGIFAGGPTQYYKFDAKDGSLLWQNSGCCEGGGGIAVSYSARRVYLVDWSAGNFVLNSKDGTAVGSFPGSNPPSFFTIGKRKFELVIASGKLYCTDVRTGNVVWSYSNNNLTGQPIAINGQPVAAAGTSVFMFDGATGAQLWTEDVGSQITGLTAGDGALAVLAGSKVIAYVPQ